MQSVNDKYYDTNVTDTEQIFRLMQSVPLPKSEPFNSWSVELDFECQNEMQDPESL
ncbi:MAG: hypothetical protein QM751_04100 [Paludibacteraceae bacterium]